MSRFLIRIQLRHTEEEKTAVYGKLHTLLYDKYIYNAMVEPGSTQFQPVWRELPRATYYTGHYSAVNASYVKAIVDEAIDEAIKSLKDDGVHITTPIKKNSIVTEAGGQQPFASDFPITSAPKRTRD